MKKSRPAWARGLKHDLKYGMTYVNGAVVPAGRRRQETILCFISSCSNAYLFSYNSPLHHYFRP